VRLRRRLALGAAIDTWRTESAASARPHHSQVDLSSIILGA
jgi:hypothetical protein